MTITVTQAYSNLGGGVLGSGTYDRSILITVTSGGFPGGLGGSEQALVTGSGAFNFNSGFTANTSHIDFQLKGKKRIATAVRISSSSSYGNWKVRASQDALTWTDIGSATLNGSSPQIIDCSSNTTPYAYYSLMPTTSSSGTGFVMSLVEFEFSGNQYEWGNRNTGSLVVASTNASMSGGGTTAMFDGVLANNGTNAWWSGDAATGKYIQFDFVDAVELMAIYSFDSGSGGDNATWKVQKWDGASWLDMSSAKLWDLSSAAGKTFPVTTDGVASTRWRMLGTAGTMNSGPFYWEFGFDIVDSSIAPSVNAVVTGVALEVMNTGDGSNAIVSAAGLEIMSTGDGSSAIVPALGIEVMMSVTPAPRRAFDGGKIFEFQYALQPETMYSESDWDSIYSVGDRAGNGLLQMDSTFPGDNFGGTPQSLIDHKANTHFDVQGGDPPVGASITWKTLDGSFQFISGFRLTTGSARSLNGWWAHLAGYDGHVWAKNTIEFDEFSITYTAPAAFDSYQYQLFFTPMFFPWNFWTITYQSPKDSDDGQFDTTSFGSELQLKVYHSVLDGGDRRTTNGRSIKRVTITTSAGIIADSSAPGIDPFDMIIDGVYASNEKAGHTHFLRVGGTPGNDAIITPGEYIQFKFPRKVVMRDTVWNTGVSFDGGEALDSGGNPTVYGTWQWQASNAANSGYVNIGDPWHFSPGSIWIRSPMPILALRQDAAEPADYNLYLYPYWRMVLVEGPAFGSAANCNLFQVQFNLIDPDNQFPLLEVAFTDDVDGVAVTATIGPMANPYAIAFTDNTDDKMTATPTIIPNLILTAAFTDGTSDGITTRGSFYPTVYSQTMVIVKGR
jgi:hypothetical protein